MRREDYTTKNLNIAAYLYASGIQFIGASRLNNVFLFHFTPKDKAENLINNYFLGNASVNPKELFARLHDLKDIIFSQK